MIATAPMEVGLGFKPQYFEEAVVESCPGIWWEIHPENYAVSGGPRWRMLEALRANHPLSLHGVSMSLAGPEPLAPERLQTLAIRIIASSGTELVGYQGFNDLDGVTLPSREVDKWDAWVAFDPDITGVRFFYPYTTTLVELVLNREPAPFEGPNRVFTFLA